jgi:hypothetical protein
MTSCASGLVSSSVLASVTSVTQWKGETTRCVATVNWPENERMRNIMTEKCEHCGQESAVMLMLDNRIRSALCTECATAYKRRDHKQRALDWLDIAESRAFPDTRQYAVSRAQVHAILALLGDEDNPGTAPNAVTRALLRKNAGAAD